MLSEDEGRVFPQNTGNHLADYMVFEPIRPHSEILSLWKPHISHNFINLILMNAEYARDINHLFTLLKGRIMFYM